MADYFPSMIRYLALVGCIALLTLLLASCNRPATTTPPRVSIPASDLKSAITMLRTMTDEANANSRTRTDALLHAVNQFLDTPDEETRTQLQQSWLDAHNAFAATRALLLNQHDDLLFAIDAWPIEPGFLDSLPDYPDSGIVNDFTVNISKETLKQQNGITANDEVCLGFHPLEYYAFARPLQDFVQIDSASPNAKNIERRRQIVSLIAAMLVDDLNQLSSAMDVDLENLQTNLKDTGTGDNERLATIVTGFQRSAHHQFQEASLLADKDDGHGRFSNSSIPALAVELRTTRAAFESSGELMGLLRRVDLTTAGNFDKTLSEVTDILDKAEPTETERVKLPVLLSAINHQFEDFKRSLPKAANGG